MEKEWFVEKDAALKSGIRRLEAFISLECTNTACGEKSWPRQDPSMIAVITSRDKGRVLLGR